MWSPSLALAFIFFAARAAAQSCDNGGTQNGTACACPPGFGGADCAQPACGGNLFQGAQRTLQQPAGGKTYANITACACQDGWAGEGCNVCTAASACQTAYNNVFGAPSTSDLAGNDAANNATMVCNTEPRVYAAGELSCDVNNPTLAGLYPGPAALTILRTLDPRLTPAPGVSGFGSNGTVLAQLWYEGEEQFWCSADTCSQTFHDDGSNGWSCSNLHCTCRPNATFCGGVPEKALTDTINSLAGTLDIDCAAPASAGAGVTCQFKQDQLVLFFGSSGIALENCRFGECVRQEVIDGNGDAVSEAPKKELSGGVIAGLAVVGALVLAALLLLGLGCFRQRKARKTGAIIDRHGGVTMEWNSVGYVVRNPHRSQFARGDAFADGHVILDGLHGRVAPGEMLAILGPSGAGKSTLIDILAGKRKAGRASGVVSFTNREGEPLRKPRIGFVDQSDVLPASLTVREALRFAADLRLPESVPGSEKSALVFGVLTQLGLADVADSRIGSPERRGISGGEQRRLSIGLALVARPDVLILDEPTSGLDAVSSYKVASVLRAVASDEHNPTVVIASIHQPSSRLFRAFDRVLLLAHGHELYHGPGGVAPATYFAERGMPCPEGYNVADHLLDIAADPPTSLISSNTSISSGQNEKVPAVLVHKTPEDAPGLENPAAATGKAQKGRGAEHATTFLTQIEVLSGREWKNLRRDKTLFIAHVAIAAVLGVFCGGLYYKTDITIAGFQSRVGCLFFLGALIAFSSLSSLYYVVDGRPLFLRERAGKYYSPTAWLLSRVLFDVIPLRILPTIIVSTITYWMAGLAHDAAHFFKFLLVLVLYSICMTLFNFLLACIFSNGGVAILLSALTCLYQMTFAGFFVHLNDIPPVLRWLQWLDTLKYTLEALSVNEVGSGLMIVDSLQGVPVNVSAQLIMNLLFGFGSNNYYRDILITVGFIIAFALGVIAAVFLRVREQR
ncbi:hypothetical protein EXIGLDRAFT_699586 [Exidia glandulosa HHB12029]|uniref:ABC transporter domain-containing protein n=1 Tax=Exidia glandulosa HHB12029 TaxID=1314781 RepID=A0A166B9I5_EXIGL|nr:hypothetical protein EXIGLDRAFT_699586 [Exidia glandulosa HHB12029]